MEKTAEKTSVQVPTTYFLQPGRTNTEETLQIARRRAEELGIRTIVVSTTGGDTALRSAQVFKGYKVVAVTHHTGFREADQQEVPAETRAILEKEGVLVHTGTHPFANLGRAVRRQFNSGPELEDIIAQTLRLLGQGTKVVCEVAMMAADAGLISIKDDIIAIAGTGRGADTAVVMHPANTRDFFAIRIKEILCKPRMEQPHAPPPPLHGPAPAPGSVQGRPAS